MMMTDVDGLDMCLILLIFFSMQDSGESGVCDWSQSHRLGCSVSAGLVKIYFECIHFGLS